jgi:uncharacterized membrane protein
MRKTIELLALLVLGYLGWITYWALNGPGRLPDRVPTHFDISGHPNAWGSPAILWIMPAVGAGLYLLFTLLASIQLRTFNLPVRVTEINLPFIQQKTSQMVALIKTEMMCLFVYIQGGIIHGARVSEFRLSPVIVPCFLAVVFVTLGIYMTLIVRGARARAALAATAAYVEK